MADPTKFLHTWEMKRTSLIIRFYEWFYGPFEASTDSLSFCKLFWSIIAAPLIAVGYLPFGICYAVIWPFVWLIKKLHSSPNVVISTRAAKERAQAAAAKTASGVEGLAARVSAFFQAHQWIGKSIKWFFLSLAAVIALSGAGGIGWLVYLLFTAKTVTAWYVIAGVAGATVFFVAMIGLIHLIAETKVGKPFFAVANFAKTGYYSTKYRTCPRIIVK